MSSRYFAFLDIGGTDLKSALVEAGTTRLEKISRRAIPPFIPQMGPKREVDPRAVVGACNKLLQEMLGKRNSFVGLLISGQMGGWLLSDEKNQPITNLVSWQDLRSEQKAADGRAISDVAKEVFGSEWLAETGNELRPGLPAVGLFEYFGLWKPADGKIRFHSFISWVAATLSNDYVFSVHPTDIAASGLYQIYRKGFARDVLDQLGTELLMPSVQEDLHIVGYSEVLGCPVYCAVGDQQASLFGAGLDDVSTVVNIGTGGQVARLANESFQESAQVRPYFDSKYIATKTHLPSGRALAAFLQVLRSDSLNEDDFEWMSNAAIESEAGIARDVVNFEREILQLKSAPNSESAETIASSVIHGIVRKYVEALELIGHRKGSPLLFAGGVGQKMKALPILIGDATESRVFISDTDETTLQGLANLAAGL